MVAVVAPGVGGIAGKLLQWPPLRYVGKISYGLYVYHPFVPKMTSAGLHAIGVAVPEYSCLGTTLNVVFALALASLSWMLLEKPINDLKRYFQ